VLCYGVELRTFCAVFVHFIRIGVYEFNSSVSRKGQTASFREDNNNDNNNKSKFVGKWIFDLLSNHQLLKIDESALWS
jgi:hypothetical protein